MAIFAKLENNIVSNIVELEPTQHFDSLEDFEKWGKSYLSELTGHYDWVLENLYLGKPIIGSFLENNRFIPPKPHNYPSWILSENFVWVPPIPLPEDSIIYSKNNTGNIYNWDEENQNWVFEKTITGES